MPVDITKEKELKEKMVANLYSKAKDCFELDNFDYAIRLFRDVLNIYPDYTKARNLYHFSILQAFRRQKSPMFYIIKHIIPFSFAYLKALILRLCKRDIKAMAAYERAFEYNPKAAAILYQVAILANSNYMTDTAITTFEKLAALKIRPYECHKNLAFMYLTKKEITKSRNNFLKACKLNPNDYDLTKGMNDLAALGTIEDGFWESEGDFTEKLLDKDLADKLKKVQSVVDKQTKDSIDLSDDAVRENYATALEALRKNPESNDVLKRVRLMRVIPEALEKFIQGYKEIISPAPPKAIFFTFLGDLYQKCDKIQDAIQCYQSALDIEEDIFTKIQIKECELILLHRKKAQGPEAALKKPSEEEFDFLYDLTKLRLELHPNDADLHFEMGSLYMRKDLTDKAIASYQRCIDTPKLRGKALITLGACFTKKGMLDLASEQYHKALEKLLIMDETKKHILYTLGDIYIKLNSLSQAREQFKQIYEVDIAYKDVGEKLEQLYKKP